MIPSLPSTLRTARINAKMGRARSFKIHEFTSVRSARFLILLHSVSYGMFSARTLGVGLLRNDPACEALVPSKVQKLVVEWR